MMFLGNLLIKSTMSAPYPVTYTAPFRRGGLAALFTGEVIQMPPWQAFVDRADFYATTRRAIERAVDGFEGACARRLAEREAIFESPERVGLIGRTRGDAPLPPVEHESAS